MNTFKLTFAYDGSAFHGYQRQKDETIETVQGVMENALWTLYKEPIVLHASGRTDAGVHARGQVAHFATSRALTPEGIVYALNRFLPRAIRILHCERCAEEFHARKMALGKQYSYTLFQGAIAPALGHQYFSYVPQDFSREVFFHALEDLVGEHCFQGFCGRGSSVKSYDRHLFAIGMENDGPWLKVYFIGDGFLRKMVRNMMGAALDIALKRWPEDSIKKALALNERTEVGRTADPEGLCLEEVYYEEKRLIEAVQACAKRSHYRLSASLPFNIK